MNTVNVRELRNHGGDVLTKVEAGEDLEVVRSGKVVAHLTPARRPAPRTSDLIARRKNLPRVDFTALRDDIDAVVDQAL